MSGFEPQPPSSSSLPSSRPPPQGEGSPPETPQRPAPASPGDLYGVLGVPHDASQEDISAAYERLATTYRIDAQIDPSLVESLRRIERAHRILSDPHMRSVYDTGFGPQEAPVITRPEPTTTRKRRSLNPVDRMTGRLPRPWRVAVDWAVTIIGAVVIVLALKQWVVNPYRIPSSSMEPTLHCARPGLGCEAHFSDRVLANRFIYRFRSPHRGEVIVFKTPPKAAEKCGAGGTFVKRLVGLPGETVTERNGIVFINGKRLKDSYVQKDRRDSRTGTWRVPKGEYFFMGDNRVQSCDSREWGSVPRGNIIGEVFFVYWPPNRIGFR